VRGPAGWWFASGGPSAFRFGGQPGRRTPPPWASRGPARRNVRPPALDRLTVSPSARLAVLPSHCLAVSPTRRRAVPPGCSAPPLASRCPGGPGAYRPSSRRRRMPCRSAVPHRAARLPSSRPVDTPAGGGGAVPLGPPPERRRESPQPRRMSAHAIFLSVRLTVLRSRCLTVWLPGQPSSRPALCPSGPVGRRPTFPATGCRAVRPTFSPPDVPSPHLAVRPSGRPAVRLSHSG